MIAQMEPGEAVEPILIPCCGLVVLVAIIVIVAVATLKRVDIEKPSNLPEPFAGTIEYATPRPRPRRKWVWPKWVWPAVGIMIAVYVVGAIGWSSWDYRTRTTTFNLIDSRTGKPITTEPSEVLPENYGAGFDFSTNIISPGRVKANWNHHCIVFFKVDGYADPGNSYAVLNEYTPAVVEVRLVPK